MRIALTHFRVGETDGVSLEMDKWRFVLEEMGHDVLYIAGSGNDPKTLIIPELHYQSSVNNKLVYNAYLSLSDFKNGKELLQHIDQLAKKVQKSFVKIIQQQQIDLIIPNNIFSLGWNLLVALGLYRALKETGIKCLCHHHDFYWEREKYANPTCDEVKGILDSYFPPIDPQFRHVVINRIAQKELKNRKNIDSKVVPNVFDFSMPAFEIDGFNVDLKQRIQFPKNAFFVLQATRIVKRKGIELAIELLSNLNQELKYTPIDGKNTAILVFAGLNEEPRYYEKLIALAEQKQVPVLNIESIVGHSRREEPQKQFALWDVYAHADLITYPSVLEGWGNQLIEAIFAKKPMVVFEYPVFKTDIAPLDLNFVSFGDSYATSSLGLITLPKEQINQTTKEAYNCLLNSSKTEHEVEHNFQVASKYLSFAALKKYLISLIDG